MSATKRRHRPVGTGSGIAGQLREIITGRGLTAYSVAHSAGIATSVVSRFLNRERGLTLETFDAIAGTLGLRLVETAKGRRPARPPGSVPDGNARQPPRPADEAPGLGHLADGPDEINVNIQAEPDGPEPCELADERLLTNADIRPEPEPVADLRKLEIRPDPRNPLLAALGAGRAT
jgi:transcriptional regulator with XRE-family HTH domain